VEKFNYILDKIKRAEFEQMPFKHLLINNLFSDEHLEIILSDNQIHFPPVTGKEELVEKLSENDYAVINFPGSTQDVDKYFKCLEENKWDNIHVSLADGELEGYGVIYRLGSYKERFILDLMSFMQGPLFKEAIEQKFGLTEPTRIVSEIQKYLTKYEISPHSDIRGKALTYLININKNSKSEQMDIHTHLLEFKDEYRHIYDIWKNDTKRDRCWVPWRWCQTKKQMNKNNSMIIFAPNNDTLHAVKLDYDHNESQRTQIYGNLMYINPKRYDRLFYKDLITSEED